MSTRSCIITKTETGYAGIYCHFDGYLEGVGQTLLKHYQDPSKVARLIALGDISSLGERVEPTGAHSFENPEDGTTVAYGRDRGETGTKAHVAPTLEDVERFYKNAHNGYVYVFDGVSWKCNGEPLAEAIAKEVAAAD